MQGEWLIADMENNFCDLHERFLQLVNEVNPTFERSILNIGVKIECIFIRAHIRSRLISELKNFSEYESYESNPRFLMTIGHTGIADHIRKHQILPKNNIGNFGGHEGGYSFWFPWEGGLEVRDSMTGTKEHSEKVLDYMKCL